MESEIRYTRDNLIKLWHIVRDKLVEPKLNREHYSSEGASIHIFLTSLESLLRTNNFDWDHFYINMKSSGVDLAIFHVEFEDLALGINELL